MKLRNIFFIASATVLLAACSKDDDKIEIPTGPVDASVSVATTLETLTKGGTNSGIDGGSGNEALVKELTAIIFDSNGILVARKDTVLSEQQIAAKASIDKIEHIPFKISLNADGVSKDTYKMVLIANAKDKLMGINSLSGIENVKTDVITTYTAKTINGIDATGYLPMVSKVMIISDLKPLSADNSDNHYENWVNNLGNVSGTKPTSNTVQLIRLIARIQLDNVKVDFSQTDYTDAQFRLTKVFLANVASTSPLRLLDSDKTKDENEADLWKGYQSDSFKVKQHIVIPATKKVSGEQVEDDNVKPLLSKTVAVGYELLSNSVGCTFSGETAIMFYAFPYNGTKFAAGQEVDNVKYYETRLILEGMFKRRASAKEELRHYHVVINTNNIAQVSPNTIYKLYVTINGEGSPNEDDILANANVSVKLEVAPWNVIHQVEEDEN